MGQRPPFETFKGATCKGCYALGTGCGTCEKCAWERQQMAGPEAMSTKAQAEELWKKTHDLAPFPGEVPFIQWLMDQLAASIANEQREAADVDDELRGDRELVDQRNRESTALCEPVTAEEARQAAQSWFIHGVWRPQDEDQMLKLLEQFRAGRAKGVGLG